MRLVKAVDEDFLLQGSCLLGWGLSTGVFARYDRGNWPAPGFEDTELGVILEPEVVYGTYAREFKLEAVRLVKERGVSVA
jgi:hypothetical protein